MKKRLVIVIVFCCILMCPVISEGQGTLKFRISGNSTRFIKEPQGNEIPDPRVQSINKDSIEQKFGPIPDFTNKGGMGFEAEVFGALSDKFYIGLEFSNDVLTGENDTPGMFNFQFTDSLQLHYNIPLNDTTYFVRSMYPLKYRTTLISFMANFRFYPMTLGRFHPFIKASAGLSLVGTELSLKNPSLWTKDTTINYGPPVLFSTDRSGVVPALTLGGGVGFELLLTEKISLYTDWSYKMVKSDLLDGRPNFDFNKDTGKLDRFNTWSTAGKLTFGITYTLNDNFSLFGGGGGGSKKGKDRGQTSPFLPYYELKPR
jgi:hypothetical protein